MEKLERGFWWGLIVGLCLFGYAETARAEVQNVWRCEASASPTGTGTVIMYGAGVNGGVAFCQDNRATLNSVCGTSLNSPSAWYSGTPSGAVGTCGLYNGVNFPGFGIIRSEDYTPPASCNTDPVIIVQAAGWDTNPNPAPGSPLAYERGPSDVGLGGCGYTWQSARLDASGFGICGTASVQGSSGMYVTRCAYNYVGTGVAPTGSMIDADTEGWTPSPPDCQGVLTTIGGASTCVPVLGAPFPATPVAPAVVDGALVPRVTPTDIYTPGTLDGGRGASFPGEASSYWTVDGQPRGNEGATTVISGGGGSGSSTITGPVSINEAGTPTDSSLQSAVDALESAKSDGVGSIEALATTSAQTDIGMTFEIIWPTVSCSNPEFLVAGHTLTVRMCEYHADIQSIMSWFFWVLGAWSIFGFIREIR